MPELHDLSALDQASAIRRREVSPVELVGHYLERIERLSDTVGAFVTVTGAAALEQATAAERAVLAGEDLPPLHGVPLAVKDLNLTAGVRTTFGSACFADFVPPIDDHVVTLLRQAGTISLGKTNTPELGLPCYTEPEVAPPARTPWDLERSAGGSSGGAAAAVAAGLVPFAQGSDGGGSIRIPASVCGLFGIKVARGRVSNGPLGGDITGLAWSGQLARTVADAAALLDVMARPMPGDPHWAPPLPPGQTFLGAAAREPGPLRIGRYSEPAVPGATVHPDCLAAWESATELLTKLGHHVEDIRLPVGPEIIPLFEVVWSVSSTGMPLDPAREGELRPLTQWLRQRGRAASGPEFFDALRGLQIAARRIIGESAQYDAVLTPTLAQPPALVGGLRDDSDPAADFNEQMRFTPYTAVYNMTGEPAVNVPLYWSDDGLPIGVMLIGRPADEVTLLSLSAQLEAASPLGRPASGVLVTETPPTSLAELAGAYGVAMSYEDAHQRQTEIADHTVVDVLRALGVDASTPASIEVALDRARRRVASPAAEPPAPLPAPAGRTWGWMLQLYSLRGRGSWGMGDYRDLADIVRWSGSAAGGRAGLVLCNPLHAMTPTLPIENSPYFPSSRRFRSPLYLRVEDTPEYAASDPATKSRVDSLRPLESDGLIDRDAVWSAKLAALEALWPHARQDEIDEFRADQGDSLDRFALFGALAEENGPDWHAWPEELRDPAGPAVARAHARLGDRVRFHAWLQLLCDEQLAAAAQAAREIGMPVGIVHDLAVGVDPGGADAWALQDVMAVGATVGCPPDSFNQLGQDWRLPPWHPTRLAQANYEPFRAMVRSVLRHAGGIRIDHVMGLFRLWWIPDGNAATDGAYVTYDWRALIGILTEEAARAGAVVIGEDLGTVETRVTEALADAGILGCDVAWFKRDKTGRTYLPPAQWRVGAIASVTTHDLPTIAGWFTDESVRVRAELDQLDRPVAEEQARAADDRADLLEVLRAESLMGSEAGAGTDVGDVALALHRLLVASPAALVVAAPGDAVGDIRQPNLPGTIDEYPNWRLPLTDDAGRPLTIEELQGDIRVRRLIEVLAQVGAPAPEAERRRLPSSA